MYKQMQGFYLPLSKYTNNLLNGDSSSDLNSNQTELPDLELQQEMSHGLSQ